MNKIELFVKGVPVSKGSMNAYNKPSLGKKQRFVVTSASGERLKVWEKSIRDNAWVEMKQQRLKVAEKEKAVSIRLEFNFDSDAICGKLPHVQKPDLDKLTRAVMDGLTGVVYTDDCQVFEIYAMKCLSLETGVRIEVSW